MTITNSGLLAIVFGITAALILFIITGIWACCQVIKHSTEEDDKFKYHVEDFYPFDIRIWQKLGEQGWELVSINYHQAIFIRRIKEDTEQ